MHTTKIVDKSQKQRLEKYLLDKEATTFVDDKRWVEFIQTFYKFPHYRSVAMNGERVEGALTLAMTDHPIFGKYLVTAPFANYGGFYVENRQSLECLTNRAKEIAQKVNAKYVVLRHKNKDIDLPAGWKENNIYATYIVDLDKDPDQIFKYSIKKRARRNVNRAFREGLTVKFGTFDLLDDFWNIITRSMKELGSPYHSKNYLLKLFDTWGKDAKIGITYTKEGDPYGCCLLLFHKDTAILLHANIVYQMNIVCGGDFLYWSLISECSREGYSNLDLGRSLIGSGNEDFKMKWKPTVYPLNYWYYLHKDLSIPNLNQSNSLYNIPRKIWKRLPLFVHKKLGPSLISGIL